MTIDMSFPSLKQSRARIARLIEEGWQRGEPAAFPALENTPVRGISIYAHVDHCVRLTRAVLALQDQGLYLEAVPLIRLSLECAVTAAWLALTPGSGDSSLREGARLRRALIVELQRAQGRPYVTELAQIEADLAELDEFRSDEAEKFMARCLSLADGSAIYLAYRDMSSVSHAGSLLTHYYVQDDEGPQGFAYVRDEDRARARVDLGTQTWLLHMTLSAWDHVMPNATRSAALKAVASEAGFRVGIARA